MSIVNKNILLKDEKNEDLVIIEYDNIKNKRELNIDLLKVILVLGMIFSHASDFFYGSSIFTDYFELVSFSGFMFVFGYNSYNAYIKTEASNKKIVKNIIKLIVTFYISGFCTYYFVYQNYDIGNYIKILFFLKLPGYSEFLATFVLLNLLILIFRNKLKEISKNNKYIFICIIISAFFAIIPAVPKKIPWVNLFIKTKNTAFPILPYLNLFFIGIYIAKNKPKFKIETLILLLYMWTIHIIMALLNLERRFPVSITYIIGSYIYLYLYYHLSKYVCIKLKNKKIQNIITVIRKKHFSFFVN